MMKLKFTSDERSICFKLDETEESVELSDLAWLFGEVLRNSPSGRLQHVVAEMIGNLEDEFSGGFNPDIDDARQRMVDAAADLRAAWEAHDEAFFGERKSSE